jgi:phosphatidylinositol-3-phosphatase
VRLRFVLPLILLAGCGGGAKSPLQQSLGPAPPTNPPPTVPPAPTASLSATPSTVQTGQAITLAWQTTNATNTIIDAIGTVPPNGSQQIIPASSTTYHLTASGSGGTRQATAQVTVTAPPPPPPSPPPPPTKQPAHVVLIIEENRSFSTVYPTGMPWMSALGDAYGIATNYFSDEPGSMTDYLWLSSGSGESAFGCAGWGCSQIITSDNIFREINKAGLSWKVYAESLPSAGFMGDSSGNYVKRHNPAPWYSDVANDPGQQQNMVPFTQFAGDLAANRLPNYSLIVPNLQDDAHDGTIAMADAWLKQNITALLSSPYFSSGGNGVLFITFDNGDGDAQGQVFTCVVGPNVIRGIKVSTSFRHENTLRTMMGLLNLTNFPGASATAAPMTEFFLK